MNDIFSVKNKVVIITGGGKGIGKTLSNAFSKNKAIVYLLDKNPIKKNEHNKDIFFRKCDITNKKLLKKICSEIFANHGKIDVLINNAGITIPGKTNLIYSEKNWLKTLDVNLTGAFLISQIVLNYMKRNRNGSIINITSINAELGFPGNPAYVASKGGLKMLSKAFAKDWGKYGIRVNNLGPGYIKTDMTNDSFTNKKIRQSRANHTLLKRWGEKDDLIGPCIFLASNASLYITGQDIYVDGGWTANGLIDDDF